MNDIDPNQIKNIFRGGFLTQPLAIREKLFKMKAFVFDWDGVFNNGFKDSSGSSPFNEVDSMGINMLRFNYYLRKGHNPLTGIISGEKNTAAFTLARREHFHSVYSSMKNKKDALLHFCAAHDIAPDEVAYFFDDVLDLSIAEVCGLRIMVGRDCNPFFINLVFENELADYITAADGGSNAIREAVELLIGLTGDYNDTIMQRVKYSDNYRTYIETRNKPQPVFYTVSDSQITEQPQP
jgi:3-deoxy-D-manno-octulosonate 8-phosphate phosphatase (KDO 8-P phosphatase)